MTMDLLAHMPGAAGRPASALYPDIQAGDWDILVDDAHGLADQARRSGVDVRFDLFPEMLHAHQLWAGNMPEADDAVARVGDYLRTFERTTV